MALRLVCVRVCVGVTVESTREEEVEEVEEEEVKPTIFDPTQIFCTDTCKKKKRKKKTLLTASEGEVERKRCNLHGSVKLKNFQKQKILLLISFVKKY